MNQRYSLQVAFIRAIFYILSIGGFLLVLATGLWAFWNSFCVNDANCNRINYLEAIGLVSIAYVVYSSIRFSQTPQEYIDSIDRHHYAATTSMSSSSDTCSTSTASQSNFQETSPNHQNTPQTSTNQTTLSTLNDEQRSQLRSELARCCGKPHDCASKNTTASLPA